MTSAAVRSVLTSLRVLERLAEPGLVGVSELARDLQVPKTSAQRMLRTLQEGGWVVEVHDQATRWTLTPKMFHLGQRHQAGNNLSTIALPVMEQLREETRETVHLAALNGDSVVVLECLESPQGVRAHVAPGMLVPVLASANGHAMLSTWSDEEIAEVISRGLIAYTSFTIADADAVADAIHEVRVRGYAVTDQQWREGVCAVSAPIVVAGKAIAGIGISTPIHRMSPEIRSKFGGMVMEAASAAAQRLGEVS